MKPSLKRLCDQAAAVILLAGLCDSAPAAGQSHRYFLARPGALVAAKVRLAAGDKTSCAALTALVQAAAKALQAEPYSVVSKSQAPPSGDRHDYMSVAPYFWPDPGKPDGMPYIRRDGETNPASHGDAFDFVRIERMAVDVDTLAMAYYFTGNERYAAHAARLLRTWFLDPKTRMNPNMNFAQAIPGVNTGRGIGILEGQNLSKAADAAGLLEGSSAWSPEDRKALMEWLETYLLWLQTSKNGRDEAAAENNHGSWYDVQTAEIALVLGKTDVARKICEGAGGKRLAAQIAPDGSQPRELARTASFTYSCYNLEALFKLATLSEHAGVDLWHFQLPNGRNALAAALDFLLPYAADASKVWPYREIRKFDRTAFSAQLREAAIVYQDPEYELVLDGFRDSAKKRFQLIHPISGEVHQ